MFCDSSQPFPDNRFALGRYLGPSTDIGPAMTAKILKSNGQVVHRSTLRALNSFELHLDEHTLARKDFDVAINSKLGELTTSNDYASDPDFETPTYDLCKDDDKHHQSLDNRDDLDDNVYDQYIKARVSLPRDGSLMKGTVSGRKRNSEGGLVGRSNKNPILDTRSYVVTFEDGRLLRRI